MFAGLAREASDRFGFTIDPHHFAMLGRCAAARRAKSSTRRRKRDEDYHRHQALDRANVRSRIPSVARTAVSEMTGKMSASRHSGAISDQS